MNIRYYIRKLKISFLLRKIKRRTRRFLNNIKPDDDEEIQLNQVYYHKFSLPNFTPVLDLPNGGGMSGHFLLLFNITRELKAQHVVEIGLGDGNSSLIFLLALKETGGMLSSIEVTPREKAIKRIRNAGLENYWNLIQGYSQDVVSKLAKKPIDILLIDGKHSYNQCKLDYLLYSPLVKSGGYIIFHDSSNFLGVKKFAEEILQQKKECMFFPWCNGIFVLRKTN
ncbi:MAG: class I SAM-dependent methyltransferase [Promethearchaeota archaeon]